METTHFSDSDKLDWEVRKLQAEVEAAKRGEAKGAVFWGSWITTILAVGAFYLQYQESQSRRSLDAVQLERAQLERDKVDHAVADANTALLQARTDLENVLQEREAAQKETETALAEFNQIKAKPPSTITPADLQSVGSKFDRSVLIQKQLNTKAMQSIKTLRPIDLGQFRTTQGAASLKD